MSFDAMCVCVCVPLESEQSEEKQKGACKISSESNFDCRLREKVEKVAEESRSAGRLSDCAR